MFNKAAIYRRREIHAQYGGQQQGGISTPGNYPFIMIFTGETGNEYGYEDGWQDNGVFYYTGEGQEGDMQFIRGNKAIRDHIENGKDIYLFEYVRQAYVKYIDQVVCVGYHYHRTHDRNGLNRQAIVFEFLPVEETLENQRSEISNDTYETLQDDTLQNLREKALASSLTETTVTNRISVTRLRSVSIRHYALKRANGVCEACHEAAPFVNKNGQPYLEVHHLRRLSDGGPDHPEWVAAICANCHRRCHHS